jgi:hypothetical protein
MCASRSCVLIFMKTMTKSSAFGELGSFTSKNIYGVSSMWAEMSGGPNTGVKYAMWAEMWTIDWCKVCHVG